MKLQEMFDGPMERRPVDKQGMVDRIINTLRSDDPDTLDQALDILSQVGIDDTMDVPTMEHILMTLDDGETRAAAGKLPRLYSQIEHLVEMP